MKVKTGLWIDHAKAVIMNIEGKKEKMVVLESSVNKHFRSPAGKNDSHPNGRRDITPDDIQERGFTEHEGVFYKKVIACLQNAEAIVIFGPGEPKEELARKIAECNLAGHVVGIETVGKLTDRQIAAKIRAYFHDKERRSGSKTVTGHAMPNFHLSRRKTDVVQRGFITK